MGEFKSSNSDFRAVNSDTMKLTSHFEVQKALWHNTFETQKKHDSFVSKPSC